MSKINPVYCSLKVEGPITQEDADSLGIGIIIGSRFNEATADFEELVVWDKVRSPSPSPHHRDELKWEGLVGYEDDEDDEEEEEEEEEAQLELIDDQEDHDDQEDQYSQEEGENHDKGTTASENEESQENSTETTSEQGQTESAQETPATS